MNTHAGQAGMDARFGERMEMEAAPICNVDVVLLVTAGGERQGVQ